jgi:hypothetical protein
LSGANLWTWGDNSKKAEDSYYSDQPEDYIFYDEDGKKIYQGIDDDVLIYLGGKWVSFEDVLMSGPSSCTYSGKTYSIIGVRMKVDGDSYLVDETSWSAAVSYEYIWKNTKTSPKREAGARCPGFFILLVTSVERSTWRSITLTNIFIHRYCHTVDDYCKNVSPF